VKRSDVTWDQIKRLWDKVSPLQRCHIVPRSLGGSDEPDNLFLMCRECHDRTPNTISRDAFFKWVDGQNCFKRGMTQVREEMDAFGVSDEEALELGDLVHSEEFKNWAQDKWGIHMSQSGHGAKITMSTLFALLVEFKKKG
jgi:hypothetical protein